MHVGRKVRRRERDGMLPLSNRQPASILQLRAHPQLCLILALGGHFQSFPEEYTECRTQDGLLRDASAQLLLVLLLCPRRRQHLSQGAQFSRNDTNVNSI